MTPSTPPPIRNADECAADRDAGVQEQPLRGGQRRAGTGEALGDARLEVGVDDLVRHGEGRLAQRCGLRASLLAALRPGLRIGAGEVGAESRLGGGRATGAGERHGEDAAEPEEHGGRAEEHDRRADQGLARRRPRRGPRGRAHRARRTPSRRTSGRRTVTVTSTDASSLTPSGTSNFTTSCWASASPWLGQHRAEGLRVGRDDTAAGVVGEGADLRVLTVTLRGRRRRRRRRRRPHRRRRRRAW